VALGSALLLVASAVVVLGRRRAATWRERVLGFVRDEIARYGRVIGIALLAVAGVFFVTRGMVRLVG
jgi:hypothetical protein